MHYQEGIKINVNKCGLMLKFLSVEKICVFNTLARLIFSYKLFVLNFALLCDSSLVVMSEKDKKSDIFSYFKRVKC